MQAPPPGLTLGVRQADTQSLPAPFIALAQLHGRQWAGITVAGGDKPKGRGFVPPFVQKAVAGPDEQDGASNFSQKTLELLAGGLICCLQCQAHVMRRLPASPPEWLQLIMHGLCARSEATKHAG